jgi:hypothetical protein
MRGDSTASRELRAGARECHGKVGDPWNENNRTDNEDDDLHLASTDGAVLVHPDITAGSRQSPDQITALFGGHQSDLVIGNHTDDSARLSGRGSRLTCRT